MEQRLAGPIPKKDSENAKGSLIKGTGANTVADSKATSVTTSEASKEKGDTPIKE